MALHMPNHRVAPQVSLVLLWLISHLNGSLCLPYVKLIGFGLVSFVAVLHGGKVLVQLFLYILWEQCNYFIIWDTHSVCISNHTASGFSRLEESGSHPASSPASSIAHIQLLFPSPFIMDLFFIPENWKDTQEYLEPLQSKTRGNLCIRVMM